VVAVAVMMAVVVTVVVMTVVVTVVGGQLISVTRCDTVCVCVTVHVWYHQTQQM
jgi:hypothetical protein